MAKFVVDVLTVKHVNTLEYDNCDVLQKLFLSYTPLWYKFTPLKVPLHSNFTVKYVYCQILAENCWTLFWNFNFKGLLNAFLGGEFVMQKNLCIYTFDQ